MHAARAGNFVGRTCTRNSVLTISRSTWSCTCCVHNWSIHINTPDSDCTPHVALLASQGEPGRWFWYVKRFVLISNRLVDNLKVPNTCKYTGGTAIPPPGHCNAISSGCSCHLNRSRRNYCVRKCLVWMESHDLWTMLQRIQTGLRIIVCRWIVFMLLSVAQQSD